MATNRSQQVSYNWYNVVYTLTTRPPSPLIDPVREKYTNEDKLVEDLKSALVGSDLADVVFIVGMLIINSLTISTVQTNIIFIA